ncbi:hypothetical protein HED60_13905 [Planctomycetales bacterium ZRK34]|nr:hypothetical protein HED60_13905 [Planctomycetales bacterium ZRK34]
MEPLTRRMNERPAWLRLICVSFYLFFCIPQFAKSLTNSPPAARARWVIWSSLIIVLLATYFAILAMGLLGWIATLPKYATDSQQHASSLAGNDDTDDLVNTLIHQQHPAQDKYVLISKGWSVLVSAVPVLVLIQSAVVPFLPRQWRKSVMESTVGFLVFLEYLHADQGAERARRLTANLLEQLADDGLLDQFTYVHILGYSFGSIVALDTMLPVGETSSRVLDSVDSITTIGCPLDFISVIWPDRINIPRQASKSLKWYNIAIRDDPVSAQTFPGFAMKEDDDRLTPTEDITEDYWGINTRLSLISKMLYRGVFLHSAYWSSEVQAQSCFDPIVDRVFKSQYILS